MTARKKGPPTGGSGANAGAPDTLEGLFPRFPGTKDIRYHPVFQGGLSRWVWRYYTHRLTRAGRWFLGLTCLLGLVGSTSLEIQTYIPFLYAFAFWTVAGAAAAFSRPRVAFVARHADRVCAGETLPVEIEIEQRGRLGGADLNVLPSGLPIPVDAIPEGGVPVPPLRRGEKARVRLGLLCRRRGVYVLRGYRVETDFPLGLLNAYRVFGEERSLLVYPPFHRLARMEMPTGRRFHAGGVALASLLGDSFEFLGNREYREGDNVRDIDWRATARLDTPILREYREEFFLRVAVVLDTHVPRGGRRDEREARRAALERAISVCAGITDYIARQEYIVDLFAAGPNLYHLTAGRSLAYLDQILDILACVEENPDEPFAVIEPQIDERLAQINSVVCVFLDWDETRRAFVENLRRGGAGVKVVLVRDAPPTLDPSGDERAGAIPVIGRADFERGVEEL
uniref:DUF58 domain-containing protein n=1 Tax=uncultured Armatimonadetes bacterium TaxID=157466 RepID=A0A6J4JBC8_9BACT|nr:hypothetical protein AVDCRST_MAG63-3183 [uncultured Armatimonadetes bacterium]